MVHDLYQEIILDHSKRPRNFRQMKDASRQAQGHNPLCGDRLSLYLDMDGDVVRDIAFVGSGCAISTASASLMTESVKGKTRAEAEDLVARFHSMLTSDRPVGPELGKLAVFSGVREYPARVKCATLCWHTLRSALNNSGQVATTEQ